MREYGVDDAGGLQILVTALEAFDGLRRHELQVQTDGAVFVDRFGQPRGHPLLPAIRDCRAQYLAGLKQLCLDVAPANHTIGRPGGK